MQREIKKLTHKIRFSEDRKKAIKRSLVFKGFCS